MILFQENTIYINNDIYDYRPDESDWGDIPYRDIENCVSYVSGMKQGDHQKVKVTLHNKLIVMITYYKSLNEYVCLVFDNSVNVTDEVLTNEGRAFVTKDTRLVVSSVLASIIYLRPNERTLPKSTRLVRKFLGSEKWNH